MKLIKIIFIALSLIIFSITGSAFAFTKGIYITQGTLENTETMNYLIKRAKAVGISTFIVDLEKPTKNYQRQIDLIRSNHIKYIARIVFYPGGGTQEQVNSREYFEKKFAIIKKAIDYGAEQIQLDYIRYNTKQPPSSKNAEKIYEIIREVKERISKYNIPLQIDVFGIASYGESKYIGQNIKMFSKTVDAICPMVYPSHYEPFRHHAVRPYQTVYDSLKSIQKQFGFQMPVKLIPYIELSNYRYPLSKAKKLEYIYAQIKAAQDSGADGYYVWSPNNWYDNLFTVLETYPVK